MSLANKFKSMFSMSEEEFNDDVDMEDEDFEEEEEYQPRRETRSSTSSFRERQPKVEPTSKVVDMRTNAPASSQGSLKTHVVFKKLDRFEDVGAVADVLNEKRIVILNLETCPNDISVRVIDFLSGVAYANSGEIKRVAGRAYIITPYNVPLTGELLDEMGRQNY